MSLHPGLVVRINHEVVAAVSSAERNILTIRIHGDVLSPEVASLNVAGGYYGDPGETRHLIWVDDRALLASEEIEIQFQDLAEDSHAGKTIDDLYPEASAPMDGDPPDMAELAEQLQDLPRSWDGFDLHVRVAEAEPQVFRVDEPNHSFGVYVMWDWKSQDVARLTISSTSLEEMAERKAGTRHLRERMGPGQSVRLRIVGRQGRA